MCVCACACVCICMCAHALPVKNSETPLTALLCVCMRVHTLTPCVELRNAPDIVITLKARGAKWIVPKFSSDGENLPWPKSVHQSALECRHVVSR